MGRLLLTWGVAPLCVEGFRRARRPQSGPPRVPEKLLGPRLRWPRARGRIGPPDRHIVDKFDFIYYDERTSPVDRSWGHEQTLACSCLGVVRHGPRPRRLWLVQLGLVQEPHAGRL